MVLTLALNYGGKEEIVAAVKAISIKVKNSIISPEKVDESTINEHLYTRNLPPVDYLLEPVVKNESVIFFCGISPMQSCILQKPYGQILQKKIYKKHC